MLIVITDLVVVNTCTQTTRQDLIEMIEDGCFNKEPVTQIIELSSGLLGRDITAEIAREIWERYDSDNRAPHHELQLWLEDFGHDCDHLGYEPEPRSMHLPPSHW